MTAPATHLLAMHGWAGDQRAWQPWGELAAARGWGFSSGERGYGQLPPQLPAWPAAAQRRIVLAHSLGPHLLPPALWQQATAVVLLASFGRFVPAGREGRLLRSALRAMAERLERGETVAMLRDFYRQAAAPHAPGRLPAGPLEQGIGEAGRERLQADLDRLAHCSDLPESFPTGVPVLLVEAADDQIVTAASRALLREALPDATVWTLPRAGHCLLEADLPAAVLDWIGDGQP